MVILHILSQSLCMVIQVRIQVTKDLGLESDLTPSESELNTSFLVRVHTPPPAPRRLIKHTEKLLEEKEEKLCIKVLQTLKEMMTVDVDYSEKVIVDQEHSVVERHYSRAPMSWLCITGNLYCLPYRVCAEIQR